MARKDRLEVIVAVSQFLSSLGERAKELLLKLAPATLADIILIIGVVLLSTVTFRFVTKDSPPVKILQSTVEIPPWVLPSILVTFATMLLLL